MEPTKPKLLLVGWDAADWEHINPLLEKGQLPTLESLINNGVMGNLATLQPVLSPILWNSIATGKHAYKHRVLGFVEPDPHHGGARPFSSVSRQTKALWNILSQNGLRCNVVNWWASHPAEPINGCVVSNSFAATKYDPRAGWNMPAGTVHPPELTAALARNKVFDHELTAEQLLPFVPNGPQINQDEDHRLSTLATNLADMLTTHSVATAVMERQPWDFMAVYFTAIDHFSHSFMVYHPPKLNRVSQADFDMYKDVINSVYRFSDMQLRRMLDLAGPDANIILCSDHGFHSGHGRPMFVPNDPTAPAAWHRQYGIFVAKGPNIKKDERVFGANLLDITPTILSIFGIATGKDMDGRPLLEIFERPPEVKSIDSWDTVPGNSGALAADAPVGSAREADELLNQLAALGYVEAPGANKQEQADHAEIECKYNLATNLSWCGKHKEAVPIFLDLIKMAAWESRFIHSLIRSLLGLGNTTMAKKVLLAAYDVRVTHNSAAVLAWAEILAIEKDVDRAYTILRGIEARHQDSPPALTQIGFHFLRLRKFDDAERAYKRAIELHAENPEAYQGLSNIYCRQGKNQETVDAALAAVGLIYQLPRAHLNLGIALARSGQRDRAISALRTALHFNNNIRKAHRWLAIIYDANPLTRDKAVWHREELDRIANQDIYGPGQTASSPDDIFELPDIPSEQDRNRITLEKRPLPEPLALRSGKCFTLVSGLPRSGTSLMMQMLEAAGLPAKSDGERTADDDNPKGYYEWEAIKQVGTHPNILDEPGLDKKVIKTISMLLGAMPYRHEYRVIFMTRPIDEVIESQTAMIKNRKTEGANLMPDELKAQMAGHRDEVLAWLSKHPRATYIEIDYPSLVKNPEPHIQKIAEFLGPDLLPHPQRMRSVIDGGLYRKRSTTN